jgi:hypothetical protein
MRGGSSSTLIWEILLDDRGRVQLITVLWCCGTSYVDVESESSVKDSFTYILKKEKKFAEIPDLLARWIKLINPETSFFPKNI